MIIQKVIKGIGDIDQTEAQRILKKGIYSNWLRKLGKIDPSQIPEQLTEENLMKHQNHYYEPDNGEPFYFHTPFISTTAGTMSREVAKQTNVPHKAWLTALYFATAGLSRDGYLFYCYLFTLGKKSVGHQAFAEELRELNIYTGFSSFHPEGEITAKILIPPSQIEKVEFWSSKKFWDDIAKLRFPSPAKVITNPAYLRAEDYHNIRDLIY